MLKEEARLFVVFAAKTFFTEKKGLRLNGPSKKWPKIFSFYRGQFSRGAHFCQDLIIFEGNEH